MLKRLIDAWDENWFSFVQVLIIILLAEAIYGIYVFIGLVNILIDNYTVL